MSLIIWTWSDANLGRTHSTRPSDCLVFHGTFGILRWILSSRHTFCGPEQALAGQQGLVTQTTPVWRHWEPSWQTRPHSGSPHTSPGFHGDFGWTYEDIPELTSHRKTYIWEHGCPQGKSDNRLDPLTLLYEGVEISPYTKDTLFGEITHTQRSCVGDIILYRFTWATFALADHTDCCGRVAGSLQQFLDSHLIRSCLEDLVWCSRLKTNRYLLVSRSQLNNDKLTTCSSHSLP